MGGDCAGLGLVWVTLEIGEGQGFEEGHPVSQFLHSIPFSYCATLKF